MKFSNGCWLDRDGVVIQSPTELYEFDTTKDSITLYGPFVKVERRGNTLDGGLMTVKLSSPLEDVIKVNMTHHAGGLQNGPSFHIATKDIAVEIENTDEYVSYTSGKLKAKMKKNTAWQLEFLYNNKELTTSKDRGMAFVEDTNDTVHMREQLSIDVGELIYGLGERFTPFVRNGQTVDIWNEDGGTGSEQSYKNIPFYVSNKGYGVFVNHPEKVSYEIASEKVSKAQFSVEGQELEYFIIGGETLKKVLENYTTLTGKPSLPPAWSFGLWLSTSFTTNYDEQTINTFIDEMSSRDIPFDVFHFDCFWMKEFEWCNFMWDERVFPDPVGMLKRLKDKGLKICLWINPYISQKSPLFKEGQANGYFIKRPNGSVWQWDKWQAGLAIVDFTNPDACKWYESKLEALLDMGVDCFKTDFGERIPTDVVYADGSDPMKMHNYYTFLYNKVVFELLERKFGKEEAVLFARSATVGGQQFPVHWGGDSWSTYPSMAESLRGGLSFSLSGFSYWSHDISGFEQGTTPDLYKRWTQFGLLSSHSRYHGNTEYKVPWLYGEEAVEVTKKFTKLKNSLMPYLYRNAVESSVTGVPMMRPMVLEFQEDETCHYLERQYMFGSDVLVAPIFNEEGNVRYYLPKGKWTNYLTNELIDGEKWHAETHGYMTLPLMVRENTILPVSATDSTATYDYTENITLEIFSLVEGTEAIAIIYDTEGVSKATVSAVLEGNIISVNTKGLKGSYKVLLRNVSNVESVQNGSLEDSELGQVITTDSELVQITLRG